MWKIVLIFVCRFCILLVSVYKAMCMRVMLIDIVSFISKCFSLPFFFFDLDIDIVRGFGLKIYKRHVLAYIHIYY